MGLNHKTITVNEEDWLYLKSLNLNLSELIRDYLTSIVNKKKSNIEGINIQIEQLKLKENLGKLTEIQAKIKESEENIKKFEEFQGKLQQEKLKKEKERIDSLKKCKICSNDLNEHNTLEYKKDLFICKTCYMEKNITHILKEKVLI